MARLFIKMNTMLNIERYELYQYFTYHLYHKRVCGNVLISTSSLRDLTLVRHWNKLTTNKTNLNEVNYI